MNPLLEELNETQYEDLYHVDDAPIADLRQKAISRLGWWAVLLAVAGFVAGYLVVLPDSIQTNFMLKSEITEDIYRFPTAVYVEKVLVQNGQKINAGDPILEISAPDIAALAAELNSAQRGVSSFEEFKNASFTSERTIVETNIKRINEEIALKKSQLSILGNKWASEAAKLQFDAQEARRLFAQNQAFYKGGDISRNELNQFEASAIRAQNAYDVAYQNYLENRNLLNREISSRHLEINGLEKQISKTTNDHLLEGNRLQGAVAAAQGRLAGVYGTYEITPDNHLLLKAKRNSTVSFLFEGDKEVPPSTILLKMIYEDAPLYAHAQVNSSQIGKVKAGQRVALKLDAYPVYEWGAVQGKVTAVSLTPDEKGLFNLRVQITDAKNVGKLLKIGMLGKANVIADERNIYGYLFRKFKKTISEWVE
jgi:multidrug efflux pump subunit AcrA (membrane-fusion protein)